MLLPLSHTYPRSLIPQLTLLLPLFHTQPRFIVPSLLTLLPPLFYTQAKFIDLFITQPLSYLHCFTLHRDGQDVQLTNDKRVVGHYSDSKAAGKTVDPGKFKDSCFTPYTEKPPPPPSVVARRQRSETN